MDVQRLVLALLGLLSASFLVIAWNRSTGHATTEQLQTVSGHGKLWDKFKGTEKLRWHDLDSWSWGQIGVSSPDPLNTIFPLNTGAGVALQSQAGNVQADRVIKLNVDGPVSSVSARGPKAHVRVTSDDPDVRVSSGDEDLADDEDV
jgi:hypothetical protein